MKVIFGTFAAQLIMLRRRSRHWYTATPRQTRYANSPLQFEVEHLDMKAKCLCAVDIVPSFSVTHRIE